MPRSFGIENQKSLSIFNFQFLTVPPTPSQYEGEMFWVGRTGHHALLAFFFANAAVHANERLHEFGETVHLPPASTFLQPRGQAPGGGSIPKGPQASSPGTLQPK